MKYIIFFIAIVCCSQIGNAQIAEQQSPTSLKDLKLKGKVKQVITFVYHDPRNIDSLKNPEKIITNFDEQGNLVDEIGYDKGLGLKVKVICDHSKANIVTNSLYDLNGNLIMKYESKYDNKRNVIEIDGRVQTMFSMKFKYKYDEKDNLIETNYYEDGQIKQKAIFIYNDSNQKIEENLTEFLENGAKTEKTMVTYNAKGNQIKFEKNDPNNKFKVEEIISYSDEDNYGNWLTQTYELRKSNKIIGTFFTKDITKREITYFK